GSTICICSPANDNCRGCGRLTTDWRLPLTDRGLRGLRAAETSAVEPGALNPKFTRGQAQMTPLMAFVPIEAPSRDPFSVLKPSFLDSFNARNASGNGRIGRKR